MNYSRSISKSVIAIFAVLLLLPAAATAYPQKGGSLDGGTTTIRLDPSLRKAMDAEGVQLLPLKPAKAQGRALSLPIDEGILEPRFGSGYVFQQGGILLRAGSRSVPLRRLVLNNNKKQLSGVVAGRAIAIAKVDEVKGRRTDFGIAVKVGSLRLTARAASIIGSRLGMADVFRPHRQLGRAFVSARLHTVPITGGEIEFTFDERFRAKLDSFGISVVPQEATPLSSAPLAFSFPGLSGEMGFHFRNGTIGTKTSGIKLVQGAGSTPTPREVVWAGVAISFENGFGGEGSDVVLAGRGAGGGPIGQIEFGGGKPDFDPKTGTISGGPTAATLSPFEAPALNDAFTHGRGIFVAGEPLGTFSFTAGVR